MARDDSALELPTRRRIFQHLVDHPGSYLRELQRSLELPMGALEYHLSQLEEAGLVTVSHDENKRFFPAGIDPGEKRAIVLLRQESARRVIMRLLNQGDATRKDLSAQLDLPPSTVSYYVKKLAAAGIVAERASGREREYYLADAERVYRLLVRYRASLLDRVLDGFLASFDDVAATRRGRD